MISLATETFGIPLAYVIVAALLLWIVIAARGNWLLKAAVIALCLFFGTVLWHSLTDLQGWPVEAEMPPRFEIKWLLVEEPDKKSGRPGSVYVWAVPLGRQEQSPLRLVNSGGGKKPRIYRLPYSRPLHEQSEMIGENLRAGKRFFASLRSGGATEGLFSGSRSGGTPEGEGRKSTGNILSEDLGGGDRPGGPASPQDYFFHELPPAKFPEKIVPDP